MYLYVMYKIVYFGFGKFFLIFFFFVFSFSASCPFLSSLPTADCLVFEVHSSIAAESTSLIPIVHNKQRLLCTMNNSRSWSQPVSKSASASFARWLPRRRHPKNYYYYRINFGINQGKSSAESPVRMKQQRLSFKFLKRHWINLSSEITQKQ